MLAVISKAWRAIVAAAGYASFIAHLKEHAEGVPLSFDTVYERALKDTPLKETVILDLVNTWVDDKDKGERWEFYDLLVTVMASLNACRELPITIATLIKLVDAYSELSRKWDFKNVVKPSKKVNQPKGGSSSRN
jgi:hypothetical protein